MPKLNFHRYDKPIREVMVKNNGHTIKVSSLSHYHPVITGAYDSNILRSDQNNVSGAWLPGSFKIEQLHFHWGNNSDFGSEHTIDSRRYPLEMHLVHYNADYPDVQAAHDKEQGLAVVSVLFDISEEDNIHLEPIMQASKKVRKHKVETEKIDSDITLANLLPRSAPESFYTYNGSLTTPPCSETVIWIVLRERSTISECQLRLFR